MCMRLVMVVAIRKMSMQRKRLYTQHHEYDADDETLSSVRRFLQRGVPFYRILNSSSYLIHMEDMAIT